MILQGYGVLKGDTTIRSRVAASTGSSQILAANTHRQRMGFLNSSATYTFYLAFGSVTASLTDYSLNLKPGDYYEDWTSIDAVQVIASGASASDYLYVTETA